MNRPRYLAPRASAVLFRFLTERKTALATCLLPANICPIVPAVFQRAGVPYLFVDVDPATLCLDLSAATGLCQRAPGRFGGILFSHAYGYEGTSIQDLAGFHQAEPGLAIIDDRCLCVPSLTAQNPIADLELYSTGYAKILELGYGGWGFADWRGPAPASATYRPADLDTLLDRFRHALATGDPFRDDPDLHWLDLGNGEPDLPTLEAAMGDPLSASLAHRAQLNAAYAECLAPWALPQGLCLWRFNLLVPDPAAVMEAIFAAGHFASRHYGSLVGIFGEGEAPVARHVGLHVLNLFNDHRYTAKRAMDLAQVVARHLPPHPTEART